MGLFDEFFDGDDHHRRQRRHDNRDRDPRGRRWPEESGDSSDEYRRPVALDDRLPAEPRRHDHHRGHGEVDLHRLKQVAFAHKKLLAIAAVIVLALVALAVVFVLPLVGKAVDTISQQGVKGIVERVWEGEGGKAPKVVPGGPAERLPAERLPEGMGGK